MAKRKRKTDQVFPDDYSLAPQKSRKAELKSLGFQMGVLKLASGNPPAPFLDLCRKPDMIYEGGTIPAGPRIVPLWESAHGTNTTVARRNQNGEVEVIEYSLESPENAEIIATHEQGALAHCFLDIIDLEISMADSDERDDAIRRLGKCARQLKFAHFDKAVQMIESDASEKQRLTFTRNAR